MRVLFVGDVVRQAGCEFLRRTLPALKKLKGVDFCVVNGENADEGNGLTPRALAELLAAGADAVTGGNHTLRRNEIYEELDRPFSVCLRPWNLHASVPGRGMLVLEKGGLRLGVGNLMGAAFMDPVDNPFDAADALVRAFDEARVRCRIVDFHAEATGEKRALGYYLDGRVSALVGTHTHVPTADAQLLPAGAAYITDAGMTGPRHSVLGISVESVTKKLRSGLPCRFEAAKGPCEMDCVLIGIDDKTGRATQIEQLLIT